MVPLFRRLFTTVPVVSKTWFLDDAIVVGSVLNCCPGGGFSLLLDQTMVTSQMLLRLS